MKTIALAFTFVLAAFACVAKSSDEFTSVATGFYIAKPSSWQFLTAQQNLDNIKQMRFADADLKALAVKYATAPLVLIVKHPEPFADFNPTVKVMIKPMGRFKGQNAKAILASTIPPLQRGLRDFAVTLPPSDTMVSGIPAAHGQFTYVMETNAGDTFPAASEVWVVPRGDYFFAISAGTRQDQATGSRSEVQRIINTVRIDP